MLVAVAALSTAPAAPASTAATRQCGTVGGEGVIPADIEADGPSCRLARRLANRVSKVAQAPFDGCVALGGTRVQLVKPCRRLGYRCQTLRRIGYRSYGIRVGCRKGARTVKWDLK